MLRFPKIAVIGIVAGTIAFVPANLKAQRFERELEMLDYRSLKFSEQDVRDIVTKMGWIAKNVLWRSDRAIAQARTALRHYKAETTSRAWELWRDELKQLAGEINMLINLAPTMADETTASADKKKADDFTRLLFAARSEVEDTRRDVERALYKTQ